MARRRLKNERGTRKGAPERATNRGKELFVGKERELFVKRRTAQHGIKEEREGRRSEIGTCVGELEEG